MVSLHAIGSLGSDETAEDAIVLGIDLIGAPAGFKHPVGVEDV